jgi:hypothetical protein
MWLSLIVPTQLVGLRWPNYTLSECIGATKSQFGCWCLNRLINLAGKLPMTMSISLVPPLPGGSGAFTLAAWNICCGRNAGLSSGAKRLAQMGVSLAISTETKVTDDRHPCLASGYKIHASKVASNNQGGIALLWKMNCRDYEVELAHIMMPNLLSFQLVTGNKQFYCMGVYIPPTDTMGVGDLWAAWEACPVGCTPLVLGDLYINFSDPWNEQEELIVDLLDDINIVDASRRFALQQPCKNHPGHGGLGGTKKRGGCITCNQIISL